MLLLTTALFAAAHAVRLPYLGGDIHDFLLNSKENDLSDPSAAWIAANRKPVAPRPITMKQKRDSTKYNSKFTDIARAYAEGYKAAIKAVQQRALIAKRRLNGFKPIAAAFPRRPMLPQIVKSTIPKAPVNPQAPKIQAPINTKSIIPSPEVPEQIPGVGESREVSNPAPSSDHETQTLPTLNGLPDSKSGLEEMVARSTIPEAPKVPEAVPEDHKEEKKSDIPSADALFAVAAPAQTNENAVEKSWIPGAESSSFDNPLNMNERSTHVEMPKYKQEDHPAFLKVPVHMRSQEERDKIARMNARARHRSVYFDGAGGDPFNGGGVLSMQNAISVKKHKRRRRSENSDEWYFVPNPHYLSRHRRSHMPYLGQNLDALGVVRATPKSWTSARIRKTIEKSKQILPAAESAYNQPEMPPAAEMGPSPFTQTMPAQFRAEIPQAPLPMMTSPMALNYAGGMFPQQQFAYRSMIPSYPAFFNQMAPGPFGFPFQSPVPSGLMPESDPSIESNLKPMEEIREKKSTILTPTELGQEQQQTATLNL